MYILNSFTEIDILCFGCMELKKISFDFHKKVKTPSCYFEKNFNTPLSFTLKKVFAPLHSAPALLYSKFFKPRHQNCQTQVFFNKMPIQNGIYFFSKDKEPF